MLNFPCNALCATVCHLLSRVLRERVSECEEQGQMGRARVERQGQEVRPTEENESFIDSDITFSPALTSSEE